MRQVPGVAGHLKEGVTLEALERQARAQTDMAAAEAMQQAKQKLWAGFARRSA